ncbi:MAG: hypothetical protein NTW12_14255 [Deltaproteobacteria bacterium]|nr:hypothetical protein [Deltaproteobacteria bacterium]
MAAKTDYVNNLIQSGQFRFEKLVLKEIDNTPVLKMNTPQMADEEICLTGRRKPLMLLKKQCPHTLRHLKRWLHRERLHP